MINPNKITSTVPTISTIVPTAPATDLATVPEASPLLKLKRGAAICLAALMVSGTLLAGCSTTQSENAESASTDAAAAAQAALNVDELDLDFTDRDTDASYDESAATLVTLKDGEAKISNGNDGITASEGIISISKEGVYVLSGTWTGQIQVDCNEEDKAKVQIVMDGLTLTSTDGPAVYVKQAKKCFVTLAKDSKNTVSDTTTYTLESDSDEPYSTIFSKANLTLQGSGSLTVNANYKHGIVSKDDLVITGGTYTVKAVEDAVRGRDCVKISDGTFKIESGEDGIKSNKDEDASAGYVYIKNGTFTISAGDDAIHAETALVIDDGDVDIKKSNEGLEGQQVIINGGDVDVISSDDGINATAGSSSNDPMGNREKGAPSEGAPSEDAPSEGASGEKNFGDGIRNENGHRNGQKPSMRSDANENAGAPQQGAAPKSEASTSNVFLKITGGTVNVDAEGDGLDSNGSMEITGGTIYVNGPTNSGNGALDCDGSATISGGTIIAVGASGMAAGFTGGSQPFTMANVSGNAGDKVVIKDESGKTLASMTAAKQFSNIVVSCPDFKSGSTYTVTVNGTSTNITPSTEATASAGGPGAGGQGKGQGFNGEQRGGQRSDAQSSSSTNQKEVAQQQETLKA